MPSQQFVAGVAEEARELCAENIRYSAVLAPHEGFYADYSLREQKVAAVQKYGFRWVVDPLIPLALLSQQ